MDDSPSPNRTLELISAFLLSLCLATLIYTVQELTKPDPADSIDWSQDPIVVFPDFASVPDIEVKKQQFFDYIHAYVHAENEAILNHREQLQLFDDILNRDSELSAMEREWVLDLAYEYQLETELENEFNTLQSIVRELLSRVDAIPVSLALAQAANESAWGTSRFTLEGNNLFGQWCYEEGCGMVPERRVRGAAHEVQRFNSVSESVSAYIRNINTHHLYQDFRESRARMRRQGKSLNSLELAYELDRYSARGEHYIDEVQTIIEQNGLQQRDRK